MSRSEWWNQTDFFCHAWGPVLFWLLLRWVWEKETECAVTVEKQGEGLCKHPSLPGWAVAIIPAITWSGGKRRIAENKTTQYWGKMSTSGYTHHQSTYHGPSTDNNGLCHTSTALEPRTHVQAERCKQNCHHSQASTRTPASHLWLLLTVWHLCSVLSFLTGAEHHHVGLKGADCGRA